MPATTLVLKTNADEKNAKPFSVEIFSPEGEGRFPAIILAFDAAGVRPALSAIAARIASWGYVVAIPDFFHRMGDVLDLVPSDKPKKASSFFPLLGDKDLMATFQKTYRAAAVGYENLEEDGRVLIESLVARPDVHGKIGVVGYCMGGNIALRLATIFGDRIFAAASFHGGGFAAPDSPHHRAEKIKAKVLIVGATEDSGYTDETKKAVDEALTKANVEHTLETYPGHHGFVVSDHPAYDAACSERHFVELKAFFEKALSK